MSAKIVWALTAVAGGAILLGQMKASGFPDHDKLSATDAILAGAVPEWPDGSLNGGSEAIDIGASRVGLNSSGCGNNFNYYGTSGGIRAFSMASTACNYGSAEAEWIAGGSARHPLIAQNIFRYLSPGEEGELFGRFEQIGQSWLKHSFCALSEGTCMPCQGNATCDYLGIGCADTYGAGLNDGRNGGPKSAVNPVGEGLTAGVANTHTHPYISPIGNNTIRGRLQIHDSDINAGGQNFAEIQYITHDEAIPNRYNNASWREVNLGLTSITGTFSCQSSVHAGEPAIKAWPTLETGVSIGTIDDCVRGRFFLGSRATDNGDGTWHYEYAVQNLNSDLSGQAFEVPLPPDVTLTNIGFHDVDYHSGEPYALTDWTATVTSDKISWSTVDFNTNPNANALRWGTLYNFRFDADAEPLEFPTAALTIVFFKPSGACPGPASETVLGQGPGIVIPPPCPTACPTDVNTDGVTNVLDLIDLLLCFGQPDTPPCDTGQDINCDLTINVLDLIDLLLAFGQTCP